MTDIAEIITRLEKADGPDLDIDHAIATAIGPSDGHGVLLYTASIDAALTLVPDGWRTAHVEQMLVGGMWFWTLKSNDPDRGGCAAGTYAFNVPVRTPAIALCISSLKARIALTHLERAKP